MESLASASIPPIAQPFVSERARRVLDRVCGLESHYAFLSFFPFCGPSTDERDTFSTLQVQKFVEEECIPGDSVYAAQLGEGDQRWRGHPGVIDVLKAKAKDLGLWNLFLPRNLFQEGPQFTNIEYALMAEQMGRSIIASEV